MDCTTNVCVTWAGSNKPISLALEPLKTRLDRLRPHEWILRAYYLQAALRDQIGCAHHCEVRVSWWPDGPEITPNPRTGAHTALKISENQYWTPSTETRRCWAALLRALAQTSSNTCDGADCCEEKRASVHLVVSRYSPVDVAISNVTWCDYSYVGVEYGRLPNSVRLKFEVVKAAAQRLSSVLDAVPVPDLRDKVVDAIIGEDGDGEVLAYASPKLQDCKELVMKAVHLCWHALEHASSRLRNDKEVVLVALRNNGYALQFASTNLQNDACLVFVALCSRLCQPSINDVGEYCEWRKGPVLRFVSDALRAHPMLGPLLALFAVARDNRSRRHTKFLVDLS